MNLNLSKNYSNILIVIYPALTGGKTVINSLGLSNSFLFQEASLVHQQLEGLLTPKEKYTILKYKLFKMLHQDAWSDLDMGSGYLEGFDETRSILQKKWWANECHRMSQYRSLIDARPNAKTLAFKNSQYVLDIREAGLPAEIDHFFIEGEDVMYWDGDNFRSRDAFVNGIAEVYSWLGLRDFNKFLVGDYYTLWHDVVEKMSRGSEEDYENFNK